MLVTAIRLFIAAVLIAVVVFVGAKVLPRPTGRTQEDKEPGPDRDDSP